MFLTSTHMKERVIWNSVFEPDRKRLIFFLCFLQTRENERTEPTQQYGLCGRLSGRDAPVLRVVWRVLCELISSETPVINLTSLADSCHTTLPPHVVRASCRRVVPSSGANGSNGLQCHHHCLYPRHNCFFKCVKGDVDRRNAQFLWFILSIANHQMAAGIHWGLLHARYGRFALPHSSTWLHCQCLII